MGSDICWLITILYRDPITVRCALRVPRDQLSDDCIGNPMKPENTEIIHNLLPPHVQSCGPIVDVERLFEVHVHV